MNNTTDYEVQQYGIFREDITLAEFDYGPNNPYGGMMEGTVAFQRGWYILDLCQEFQA